MKHLNILADIGNSQQPRRKVAQTYGKKSGTISKFQQQKIFGYDKDDIENEFEKLSIKPSSPKTDITTLSCTSTGQLHQRKENRATPRVKSPRRNCARPESRHEDDHAYDKLFDIAGSIGFESFNAFDSKLSKHFAIEKIGEGSFAEVFKLTALAPSTFSCKSREHPIFEVTGKPSLPTSLACNSQRYTSIIKIIPLADHTTPAESLDRCSSIASVSHEINILKQLDPVHGFTRFRGLRLVRGEWPLSFLEAYRHFRKLHRKRAINAPPDQDFGSQQVYALVEMDDAGSEISLIKRPSVFQVWDIFWISAILLANAEECIEFEHRDLHMSNICVKAAGTLSELQSLGEQDDQNLPSIKAKSSELTALEHVSQPKQSLDIDTAMLMGMKEEPENRIGLSGLRVTVIDYTVARARLCLEDADSSPSKSTKSKFVSARNSINSNPGTIDGNDIIFDPMIFTSDPFSPDIEDLESHVQNLTYMKTRAIAQYNEKMSQRTITADNNCADQNNHNKWRSFIPRTNVVWLGYLLRILLHRARGRTGKLYVLKGKAGKDGNNKLVKQIQDRMWATLTEVSKVVNGNDHQDVEDQGCSSRISTGKSAKGGDGMEEPRWTEKELEDLPGSSLAVLEKAVQTGWLSAEDIQSFRTVLEDESS